MTEDPKRAGKNLRWQMAIAQTAQKGCPLPRAREALRLAEEALGAAVVGRCGECGNPVIEGDLRSPGDGVIFCADQALLLSDVEQDLAEAVASNDPYGYRSFEALAEDLECIRAYIAAEGDHRVLVTA